MTRLFGSLRVLGLCVLLPLWSSAAADGGQTTPAPSVRIPRLETAPTLEDFVSMEPSSDVARSMARVDGFRQNTPRDGDPISQRTEAYLGYDDVNVYVVFVCFDSEPDKLRATLARREDILGDDKVEIFLDTFNDQRRSYVFTVNPLGVQADGTWVEQEGSQYDRSFDTVWDSGGTLTPEGYVALIAVPFKSLRFSPENSQEWGLILARWIQRNNEGSFWPYVTSRIEGRLNQGGSLLGISDVSPGRNLQLIPYGFFRSFRVLDDRDESNSHYVSDSGEFDGGVDLKTVFRDSLVLDVTANPDFNQVESDQPQVTTNQRFEVFFPERRPFFLENSSYFETPIDLFFSRRIVDPQLGVRLTGKAGPYAIGALYANDRAPGQRVPEDDPLFGEKSQNAVFRLSRDVGNLSSVGMIYTDTELQDSFNRVGGLDGRLRINPNWVATAQGVASSTRTTDGEDLSGPAFDAVLTRTGRKLSYEAAYNDGSPGFRTALGFLPGSRGRARPGRARNVALPLRPDFRGLRQTLTSPSEGSMGDRYPAFSPDGSLLAFVRSGQPVGSEDLDVWIQPTEGGEARRLTSQSYDLCEAPTWTPDGAEILFTVGGGIRRVSAESGEPKRILGVGRNAALPSLQGNRMVFQQITNQPLDIWRRSGRRGSNPDQAPERLIASSTSDVLPDYSPDGRRIAFSSRRSGAMNVWICDSDGANPVQLTSFENAGMSRWSPDSRRIVFTSPDAGDQNVYVVEADGGVPRRLTPGPSSDALGTWSRDGRWVYFRSNRSGTNQIWKIPAGGGEAVQVTTGGGDYALESWDGRDVYYTKIGPTSGIWRVPVGGGEEAQVLPVPGLGWRGLSVSRSGLYYFRRLAARAEHTASTGGRGAGYAIDFLDLESGQVTEVFEDEGFYPWVDLAVSPDDRWILTVKQPLPVSELMLMENFR